MKKLFALILTLCLLAAVPALADVDLTGYAIANGHVTAVDFVDITAPYSGTLASFDLEAGDRVAAGNTLFSLLVTTLYATEDGTVGAIFAQEGDSAEAVMARYGGVLAMEGSVSQQINATTTGAYNDEKNRTIHIGETLYFESAKSGKEEGTGQVVAVSENGYVVDILTGSFDMKENLTLYRSDNYASKDCVGKGVVARRNPVLLSGSGRVAQVLVQQGDQVKRGQPLMTFMAQDADQDASPTVTAPDDGVVASVAVSPCQQVWKGALLARVYLTDRLEIVAQVDEMDLGSLQVGDVIPYTLDTDESQVLNGTVTEISALGVTQQNAAYYAVHVSISTTAPLGASASVYLPKK